MSGQPLITDLMPVSKKPRVQRDKRKRMSGTKTVGKALRKHARVEEDLGMEVDVDGDGYADFRISPIHPSVFGHSRNSSRRAKSQTMYSKRARTSKSYAPTSSTTKVKSTSGGKVYISGREHLKDVMGSIPFSWCPDCDAWKQSGVNVSEKSLLISPETKVFTWLNNLSKSFQTYKFKYFNIVYEPSCSTATEGSIILGFNNDNYAIDPVSWSKATDWPVTVHGAPWSPLRLNIPPRALSKRKEFHMQKTSDVKTTDDFRKDPWEYFAGCIGFGVDAIDVAHDAKFVGKLYVEYGINFYKVQEAGGIVTSKVAGKMLSTAHFERAGQQSFAGTAIPAQCVNAQGALLGDDKFVALQTAQTATRVGQNLIVMDPVTGVMTSAVDQDIQVMFNIRGTGVDGARKFVGADLLINGSSASGQEYLLFASGNNVVIQPMTLVWMARLSAGDVIVLDLNTSGTWATVDWNVEITPAIFDLHN